MFQVSERQAGGEGLVARGSLVLDGGCCPDAGVAFKFLGSWHHAGGTGPGCKAAVNPAGLDAQASA